MAKWIANTYKTVGLLEAAIEAIDNTVLIHVIADKEGGYILIQAT
jgi:hypothetical protein